MIDRNNTGKSAILEALFLFPNPEESVLGYSKLHFVRDLLHSGESLTYGYWGDAKIQYTFEYYWDDYPLLCEYEIVIGKESFSRLSNFEVKSNDKKDIEKFSEKLAEVVGYGGVAVLSKTKEKIIEEKK